MAFSTVGFDGTVTEAQWSAIMAAAGTGLAPSVVTTGFDVTPGGTTRSLSVAAGTALVAGVLVTSSATESLTATANAGSSNRLDLLVLSVNWATNTVSLEVLVGGIALPTPTQTPGVLWQVPLASITVIPGAGVFDTSAIVARKPIPRIPRAVVLDIADSFSGAGAAGAVRTLATLTFGDPGWPYRIDARGDCRVRGTGSTSGSVGSTSGYVRLSVRLDGATISEGVSPNLAHGTLPVQVTGLSGVRTGPVTVTLVASPDSIPSGGDYEVFGAVDQFVAWQIPA